MNQAKPWPPIVRLVPPLIALALILFPFGWLGEVWRPLGAVIDWLFPNAWAHAIGHASLFGLLGLLALAAIPALRRRHWVYVGLLLLAGVGQEAFQAVYKGQLLVFDDTRDLLTDLVGLLAAFAMAWVWRLQQSDELREKAASPRHIEPVDDVGRAAD
jgi:MYXO-CTERM domain-containing protein